MKTKSPNTNLIKAAEALLAYDDENHICDDSADDGEMTEVWQSSELSQLLNALREAVAASKKGRR